MKKTSDKQLILSLYLSKGFLYCSPLAFAGCFVIAHNFLGTFLIGFLLLLPMYKSVMFFKECHDTLKKEIEQRNQKIGLN